jgi:integrase
MQLTDVSIDNPVKKVAKPSKTTNVIKTISDEEFDQLLTACNGELKYQAAIGLAYYAGLRASEILGLEWDQVDLENKTITICKRVVEGKLDNTTKSGRSRIIPISGSLLRILQTLKFDDKQNRYLISNKNGSHYHHIQNVFSRLKSRIASDFDGGIHVLRHTFATNAVTNGVNLPVVQKWMGHSDIKTTMGYVHITDKHSAEQMQLMK